MNISQIEERISFPVSNMAENLQGSEIIKLAGEINEKILRGKKIFNFTIGDYDPEIFPIPEELTSEIILAYQNKQTNYPAANGIKALREAVSGFIEAYQGLKYGEDEFLIAGGARPLIYAAYQTLVDPGDKVVFPVPSWNNNHYTHLSGAQAVFVETSPEHNFMPTAEELKAHLKGASLLSLCSPLNPTGTVFSEEGLREICALVIQENESRPPGAKPLYLLYDQIYWMLTFGKTRHVDPVSLFPEIRPYTLYIDGISKSLAATGVRVGWAMGPAYIIDKMKSILGHIGAWAPKAEQVATAKYLNNRQAVNNYIEKHKEKVRERLNSLYSGFISLESEGLPVRAISPQAAIYLTVCFSLVGKRTSNGNDLKTTEDVTRFLLEDSGIAMVPFSAFGASSDSNWYRISVGTCEIAQIEEVISSIRKSIQSLI